MLDRVSAFIAAEDLLPPQGRVIVALSGGADSLCLLHILLQLCGPGKPFPEVHLHVAHLDHQLRPSSAAEALALSSLVTHLGLPITTAEADVYALAREQHRSLEEAARIARYRFLREVAAGDPIAVAHHQDDHVETLLLHWIRGGGIASMLGLRARQGDIIRPLLTVTAADTHAYCAQHGLTPIEDESNTDRRFIRNRIRHDILPLLAEINPGIRETLTRTAEVIAVDVAWIEAQVQEHWPEVVLSMQDSEITLGVSALLKLPLSLQRHLLRHVTARLCSGQSPLELRHFLLLEELLQRPSTAQTLTLHLPQQLHAVRIGDILSVRHIQNNGPLMDVTEPQEVALSIPGTCSVPGTPWQAHAEWLPAALTHRVLQAVQQDDWQTVWSLLPSSQDTVYVDGDALRGGPSAPLTLRLRTRRNGDRIQPIGMRYEKKVQDVLVNKHIPRELRAQLPLFFSDTHCIWLAGVQLDHRVRITEQTKHIVRLSITRISQ